MALVGRAGDTGDTWHKGHTGLTGMTEPTVTEISCAGWANRVDWADRDMDQTFEKVLRTETISYRLSYRIQFSRRWRI